MNGIRCKLSVVGAGSDQDRVARRQVSRRRCHGTRRDAAQTDLDAGQTILFPGQLGQAHYFLFFVVWSRVCYVGISVLLFCSVHYILRFISVSIFISCSSRFSSGQLSTYSMLIGKLYSLEMLNVTYFPLFSTLSTNYCLLHNFYSFILHPK